MVPESINGRKKFKVVYVVLESQYQASMTVACKRINAAQVKAPLSLFCSASTFKISSLIIFCYNEWSIFAMFRSMFHYEALPACLPNIRYYECRRGSDALLVFYKSLATYILVRVLYWSLATGITMFHIVVCTEFESC